MERKLQSITSGRTRLTLDETGAIAQVADVKSGHIYFDANETDRRLFQLIVPSPAWKSRPITTAQSGRPKVTETKSALTLRYDNLQMAGQPTGISATVRFELPPETDEIRLSLRLANHGAATITAVIFPWINGWQSPGDPARDGILLGPFTKTTPSEFPHWTMAWGNGGWGQEQSADLLVVPWIDFSGENGGVSCLNYQREPRRHFACVRNMAGHEPGRRLGMFWNFAFAYVPPGHDWESPPVGIAVHDGDWHRTADRYRHWAQTWLKPAPAKRSFRESIGSEHVFFSYFDGTPIRPYETLPEIAATAREHGVREVCVWDRLSLGLYGAAGPTEDLLAYGPEDRRRLSRAVRQAVAGGSDVSALVNFRLINPALEVFKKNGFANEVQRNLDGTPRTECYSGSRIPGNAVAPHLGPACRIFSSFSETYRRRLRQQVEEYLDLGYTSLFYDQPFEQGADYSRKDQGHAPEMTYAALLDLIQAVREKLRARNPNATIMGEHADIFGSEILDQWMHWYWSSKDLAAAIRIHYAMPRTVINCVLDREPGLASHAFAAGLHLFLMTKGGDGTLADAPAFAAHIKKLAQLRQRCAERTVHARFNDTQGFALESTAGLVAYSYDSPAGPAIIVAAPDKAGSATITADRAAFTQPGDPPHGVVHFLDGSSKKMSGDRANIELVKHGVAVWVL